MERNQITTFSAKPGFALPAVLFIAVLGILLGFGRLLVFNNQCRLRFDRQQELEKVFAVRSALNRLQNGTPTMLKLPEEGAPDELMVMRSDSGREVKVWIHPADAIFPHAEKIRHFCVGRETSVDGYSHIDGTEYKYESSVSGDLSLKRVLGQGDDYVCLMPTNAVPGDVCRLSLDMFDTGRWSDDPFGRRYAFNVYSFAGTNEHDLVRLILRRKRRGEVFAGRVGQIGKGDNSWRPAQDKESVIYAELSTSELGAGSFTAWTQSCIGDALQPPFPCVQCVVTNSVSEVHLNRNGFGIQLVGRRLSLFQAYPPSSSLFKQHNIVGSGLIPESVYFDFTNDVKSVVGDSSSLLSDMVMELEVVASSSRNLAMGTVTAENNFNRLEVFPAFEYEINIENKGERVRADVPAESKLATVVHLDISDDERNTPCTAITYDTHGTEVKGWRTGERMSWGLIR